jgi:outer membrane protein OmpA-like peptidoglycan-associated protein
MLYYLKEEFPACVIKSIAILMLFGISGDMLAQAIDEVPTAQLISLARQAESYKDYYTASKYYEEYGRRKGDEAEVKEKLAFAYVRSNQFKKAVDEIEELRQEEDHKISLLDFYLGSIYQSFDQCTRAIPLLEDFKKNYKPKKREKKYLILAKTIIEGCEIYQGKEDSTNLYVKPLPATINGQHVEASPVITPEGNLIYNSLRISGQNTYDFATDSLPERQFYEAIPFAENWSGYEAWKLAPDLPLREEVNGTFNPSYDKFYFTACAENKLNETNCDLYVAHLTDTGFREVRKLGRGVNTRFNETQPSIGFDQKGREVLYFASDRKGGKGGFDLWYAIYDLRKGKFKPARNCGNIINTVGDEQTPFWDSGSGNFYFSSNGHPGIGQYDIFKAAGECSRWGKIENLKKPINSGFDDLYFHRDKAGHQGLFVSNRNHLQKNNFCCDDIFYFIDPDFVRLNYQGVVELQQDGGTPRRAPVVIKIYQVNDSTGDAFLLKSLQTEEDGSFNLRLEAGYKYELELQRKGFLTLSKIISTKHKTSTEAAGLRYVLQPMPTEPLVFGHLYYGSAKADLTFESKQYIDTTLYKLLMRNPTSIIEIRAHTDNIGSTTSNQQLSQQRAENVRKYLVSKGIDRERLIARGFGESEPIAPNKNADGSDNPEGRAKNRRTEIKFVGELEEETGED